MTVYEDTEPHWWYFLVWLAAVFIVIFLPAVALGLGWEWLFWAWAVMWVVFISVPVYRLMFIGRSP